MKKVVRILGLCALAAFAFTSCNKEEETELTFKASITQPTDGAKTHIGDNNMLVWNEGNTIKVFNANGVVGDFTTTDQDVVEATFSGTLPQTSTYTAFYPNAAVNESAVTLNLPSEQSYVESDFANDLYPMAAAGALNNDVVNFQFHSPASVLRLVLKSDNNCTVKSITMTGGANDVLVGNIVYANYSDVETYSFTNGTRVVTLNYPNGKQLAANEETDFNFVVLSGTMSAGTKFEVKDMNGNVIKTLTTTRPNTLTAEHILVMPVMEISYELPNVVTTAATNVTYQTASINGTYSYPAGAPVTSCGFYWGTNQAAVANGTATKVTATLGTPMSYPLTGLTASTTYYFKAWGVNDSGESCGAVMSFTTPAAPTPTVTTNDATNVTNPSGTTTTGSATMNGAYNANGTTITEVGFYFADAAATLNNVNNCTKVAISQWTGTTFSYNIAGLAPGTYYYKAYAKTTTEYYGGVKSFTINQPSVPGAYSTSPTRKVVFAPANLQYNINPNASESSTATPQWRFAEHQWDFVGETANCQNAWDRFFYANNVTPENDPTVGNRYIDLFSWGTSDIDEFATRPWFMIRDSDPSNGAGIAGPGGAANLGIGYSLGAPSNYTWYCPGHNDISGTNFDWGQANAIYNPRTGEIDQAGTWRTLTGSYYMDSHPEEGEWYYVTKIRAASTLNGTANARYCKAQVNGVNGLILFPDEYTHPSGVALPNYINEPDVRCSENTYSATEWAAMEAAYATFLPCGGTRHGWGYKENVWISNAWYTGQLLVQGQDNYGGYYWSSSYRANMQAGTLRFLDATGGDQTNVNGGNNYNRELGCCVRLARTVVGNEPWE